MDDEDNITHIFDDSQLLNDRWRQVKRWWKQSKFLGSFPEPMGHVQLANGERYDIPHHGQWMYSEGDGIAHDDGEKRTIYNKDIEHVKIVNSDLMTPADIHKMCDMPGVPLQGADYDHFNIYSVFGGKGREPISYFKHSRGSHQRLWKFNLLYNQIDKPWMKIVKNWEAEGIRISSVNHSSWIIVSFKTYFIFRYNRIIEVVG